MTSCFTQIISVHVLVSIWQCMLELWMPCMYLQAGTLSNLD